MTTKRTYTAAAPSGEIFTKTSTREITHAVLVYGTHWNNAALHWRTLSFTGSEALARKEADRNRGKINDEQIVVVAVSVA